MQRLADAGLVAVGRGGVDVPVARQQRARDNLRGVRGRYLEDAEPELRYLGSVAQGDAWDLLADY